MNEKLYAGLMTGTSVDAVDAVLCRFDSRSTDIVAAVEAPIPESLRNRIMTLIDRPQAVSLDMLGSVHRELGLLYAATLDSLLGKAGVSPARVAAAGCHGQTVRHRADLQPPFTLQIGDAATVAALCGVTTVSDFRSADIALGGQGAPLVPAFHAWAFAHAQTTRVIVNIGGIANITVLQPGSPVTGFDTGPGNTLLDLWVCEQRGEPFDAEGRWAASGSSSAGLLERMLEDPYFALPAPKSTGREYFHREWLSRHLAAAGAADPGDIQATLAELTARSIANAIRTRAPGAEVYVCGGGARNADLLGRLQAALPGQPVASTGALGIAPDLIEATAFAFLARARLCNEPGNLPAVTGARRAAVLGCVHHAGEA